MSFVHGKSAQILLGDGGQGFDLTGYLNKVTPSVSVDVAECSTFGQNSKTYVAGLIEGKFSMEGYFEFIDGTPDTGIDAVLSSVMGHDQSSPNGDIIVVECPAGGAAFGDIARSITGVSSSYEIDTPVDGVIAIKSEIQADSRIETGYVLQPLAALSGGVDVPTSGHDDGVGVAARTQALILTVVTTEHDLAASATFRLQTSPDNSIWTDVAGSTITVADKSAQRVRVAIAADRYVRLMRADNGAAHTSFASYAREYL